MYRNANNEEMVICPYNRFHVVSKIRMQKHINKCRKNYPDVQLATCFYNFCHKVKPEEMLEHYEVCYNKNRVEASNLTGEDCDSAVSSPKKMKEESKSLSVEEMNFLNSLNDGNNQDPSSPFVDLIELWDELSDSDDSANAKPLVPLARPKKMSKALALSRHNRNKLEEHFALKSNAKGRYITPKTSESVKLSLSSSSESSDNDSLDDASELSFFMCYLSDSDNSSYSSETISSPILSNESVLPTSNISSPVVNSSSSSIIDDITEIDLLLNSFDKYF